MEYFGYILLAINLATDRIRLIRLKRRSFL